MTNLIYFDKESDLALLTMAFQNKADSDLVQDYTGFSNGLVFDPNEPKLLDTVYAFGCPAEFESSVSRGIISHTERKLKSKPEYMQDKFEDCDYFYQTDAAINGGNSGGPLINEHAMVVGVAVCKVEESSVENVSFAIPSKRVEMFLADVESSLEPKIDDNEGHFYATTNKEHCNVLKGYLSCDPEGLKNFISKSGVDMPDKVLVLKNANWVNFTFKRYNSDICEGNVLDLKTVENLVIYRINGQPVDEVLLENLPEDKLRALRNESKFDALNYESIENIGRSQVTFIRAEKIS